MCTVDNKAPQSNPFTQRIAKNKVPPPGGRWWRQPPKGVHFRRPQGGCMVFRRAKARLFGFRRQRRHKKWRPKGRHTFPAERYYIPPEGGALNPPVRRSRSQAEPWQPRADRPGGCLNPHARKGVSTFGNTGKHRPYPSSTPFLFNISYLYSINHSHMQKIVMPSYSPLFSFDFLKFPY